MLCKQAATCIGNNNSVYLMLFLIIVAGILHASILRTIALICIQLITFSTCVILGLQ